MFQAVGKGLKDLQVGRLDHDFSLFWADLSGFDPGTLLISQRRKIKVAQQIRLRLVHVLNVACIRARTGNPSGRVRER